MGRRRSQPKFQPPLREGVNPSELRLPDQQWSTVAAYLQSRFPDQADRLVEKFASADILDDSGNVIDMATGYVAGQVIYIYRDLEDEPTLPHQLEILYRDDRLVVIDKPHFLASTPRGSFVTRSALVQLRRDLDAPALSPAHRLDRLTAGLLMFTTEPQFRRPYQLLFADRLVNKSYEAVAGYDSRVVLPQVVRTRIVKYRGIRQAEQSLADPNSETLVELAWHRGGLAGFKLSPRTGKTHQLRLHMASMGLPILGDNLYPSAYDVAETDYSQPLQLLARSLRFTDPISLEPREFISRQVLQSWKLQ